MVSKTIADYRKELNYHGRFEIVFAASGMAHRDYALLRFYDNLKSNLLEINKRLFLPTADLDWNQRLVIIHSQLEKVIVPSSELVLTFGEQRRTHEGPELDRPNEPTTSLILDSAHNSLIPITYFVPSCVFQKDNRYRLVEYSDLDDAQKKVMDFVKTFYGITP